MSYCKYHPLNAARFYCNHCESHLCKTCIDEGRDATKHRCLCCGSEVTSVGVTADVLPFWRRIDVAFKYPLATEVLVMIGLISLMTTLAAYLSLPLMVALNLIGAAVIIKYCFNCLSATAKGKMTPPDFSESYEGSILLVFKLALIITGLSVIAISAYIYLNPAFGSLLGFLLIAVFPAIIILYAITENLLDAINPLQIIGLISRIGLPYCLILGIILIMMTSVGILSDLIIYQQNALTLVFQSAVANYYFVVTFHIMGYMIFQYQHELGYTADLEDSNATQIRPEAEKISARVHVMIKEGRWQEANSTLKESILRFKDNSHLNADYFRFTLSQLPAHRSDPAKQAEAQLCFENYFSFLVRNHHTRTLYIDYQKVILALPNYQPEAARLRFELAKACSNNGNAKQAVKLLYGLHKSDPSFLHLIPAYELLANELDELPNMEKQAHQCRALVQALKARNPEPETDQEETLQKQTEGYSSGAVNQNNEDENGSENGELAPIEYKP
ncbi:hypothetical protein [Litoribacillus peritrichatus]|uniref:DUF4013 domain-containing protein n=1 Tax=Litoribacillus peritrichatus TaxID=718191 RepID=A0ABP7NA44_9GAMM